MTLNQLRKGDTFKFRNGKSLYVFLGFTNENNTKRANYKRVFIQNSAKPFQSQWLSSIVYLDK